MVETTGRILLRRTSQGRARKLFKNFREISDRNLKNDMNPGGECISSRKIYIKLSERERERVITSYTESYTDTLMSDETIQEKMKYHRCFKDFDFSVSLTGIIS